MCPSQGYDFSGIEVTIADTDGMPVTGSLAVTDTMDSYSFPDLFPCSQYTAELNLDRISTCYSELDGYTITVSFTINEDGTDFSNINQ